MTGIIITLVILGVLVAVLLVLVYVLLRVTVEEQEKRTSIEDRFDRLCKSVDTKFDGVSKRIADAPRANDLTTRIGSVEDDVYRLKGRTDHDRAAFRKELKELKGCISPRQKKQPKGTPKSSFERIAEQGPLDELGEKK